MVFYLCVALFPFHILIGSILIVNRGSYSLCVVTSAQIKRVFCEMSLFGILIDIGDFVKFDCIGRIKGIVWLHI